MVKDGGESKDGATRSRLFFRVRVAVLLAILIGLVSYAWIDRRRRRARNAWDHTLDVAIVAVRMGPVSDESFSTMRERIPLLEERLDDQLHRYRSRSMRPFAFTLAGPVDMDRPPPTLDSESLWDQLRYAYRLWRYARDADARAGLDSEPFDARIYLSARPPSTEERQMVEGSSQQKGRLGTVEVELDPGMVDFALFVVCHELMHTLGANDKYGPSGRTLIPRGLAEPNLKPLYPQRYAEVMARNRPISRSKEVPPVSLDELGVGPDTAAEIGWVKSE
jgi:hypothetical protein